MKKYQFAVIGGGHMGQAILSNLIAKKVFPARAVIVADHNRQKIENIKKKYGVSVTTDNRQAAESDTIMLAVKPQQAKEVFQDLAGLIKDQTIITIMAGLTLEKVRHALGARNIVRAMPNTPAQIGQGMTVWRKRGSVNLGQIKRIFRSLGEEFIVDSDEMIDRAASLSGSSPAYIYQIMEYLTEIACAYGFSEKQAQSLVNQGFIGGINLLAASKKSPAELREAVTSKKGTTEAALKVFAKRKLALIFRQALDATLKRANEIKKQYG